MNRLNRRLVSGGVGIRMNMVRVSKSTSCGDSCGSIVRRILLQGRSGCCQNEAGSWRSFIGIPEIINYLGKCLFCAIFDQDEITSFVRKLPKRITAVVAALIDQQHASASCPRFAFRLFHSPKCSQQYWPIAST